jgi:hypothetical protein
MNAATGTDDIDDIYRALQRNAGRERVTDGNVDALIERARRDGDAQLELLLREWRSSCGEDAPPSSTVQGLPPPAGGARR